MVSDLPLVSLLKARLHWHQTRQKVLAENVANADTPGFKPVDLKPFSPGSSGGALAAIRTEAGHVSPSRTRSGEDATGARLFETSPSGNAVNLEDEMMKVAQNQSDFQLAASLYQKSLQMLRIAAGRGR